MSYHQLTVAIGVSINPGPRFGVETVDFYRMFRWMPPKKLPTTSSNTTTDVYMQSLEAEVRTAINSIHSELTGTGTSGPALQEAKKA